MDDNLYFKRIGVQESLPVTIQTLAYLQRQHLLQVPFENLDIWYRKPIVLDIDTIYRKIVIDRRGGYCYECNGLFHALLCHLGFDARMISCRVVTGKHIGEAYDHMAIIVMLDGVEWLVDVGFGDFSIAPLKLEYGLDQYDGRNTYRIGPYGHVDGQQYDCAVRMKTSRAKFQPVYLFHRAACRLSEFNVMNAWQQSATESHFTKQLICSRLTETGRISLIGNRVVITHGPDKEEKLLYSDASCRELMVAEMGMSDAQLKALMDRPSTVLK